MMLGLPFLSWKFYKKIESWIGEKEFSVVSKEARYDALQEEITQTLETYTTEKYGTLPALVIGVDMGWLKCSSGKPYDSPSGVLQAVGA